jgi:hypothetical protein
VNISAFWASLYTDDKDFYVIRADKQGLFDFD